MSDQLYLLLTMRVLLIPMMGGREYGSMKTMHYFGRKAVDKAFMCLTSSFRSDA